MLIKITWNIKTTNFETDIVHIYDYNVHNENNKKLSYCTFSLSINKIIFPMPNS